MNQLIQFDSAEMLVAHEIDVSKLALKEQIEKIFELAALSLQKEGLGMNDIIYIIAEMSDMRDRPILNEAQKVVWTDPKHYPCRIILERGGFKAGAGLRLMFTATKAPHVQVTSLKGQVPTGPFARSSVVGKRVYGSGVRAIVPGTQNKVSDDLQECARQCLKNLAINMEESGTDIKKAYSFVVYLTDLRDTPKVLEVFEEWKLSQSEVQLQFEYIDALNEYHDIEIACNAYL
ncbi:MAG: RidA family protein [Sphaerochaetaceae bacterium]